MTLWVVLWGTILGNAVFHGAVFAALRWLERREARRRTRCETCLADGARMIRLSVGPDGVRMIRLCGPCFAEAAAMQEGQADG